MIVYLQYKTKSVKKCSDEELALVYIYQINPRPDAVNYPDRTEV